MSDARRAEVAARLEIAEGELDRLLGDPDGNRREIDVQARIVKTIDAILGRLDRDASRRPSTRSTARERIAAALTKAEEAK